MKKNWLKNRFFFVYKVFQNSYSCGIINYSKILILLTWRMG